MLFNILFGINALILLLVLISLIKQFFIVTHAKHLTQQQKNLEISLRENVLVSVNQLQQLLLEKWGNARFEQNQQAADLKEQLQQMLTTNRTRLDERQFETLKVLQDTLQKVAVENRQQLKEAIQDSAKEMSSRLQQLTITTENKLKEINQQVEKKLLEGFEKTNQTFNDVVTRLALIDAAQKKITELSTNVMSLQDLLNDKRSRGAFGEVQLSALINNMIPEQHYSFQHQLSNNRRPDCMLFLPEPTGNIAIDAKFPLENFRHMIDSSLSEIEKQQATKQFKIDIKKHIQDIADKYIIPNETSDGAVMFIPAEAVFAEIHARHADLVEFAHQTKVWMVSPTTMMAILTTARAVLKDAATRKQIYEIQKHLKCLAEDFERFQMRMDNLAKRIAQAHSDVEQIHVSSRKITQRFMHIENADLKTMKIEDPIIPPMPVGGIESPVSIISG